ncbi:hypothetical protein QTP70_012084 [Hemibagrus guttatus]|uniref:Reverse transcriptase domain-containing protein n=1 Tax=Hemibagrus guttatus TaxID=175788 RepID=A0AAE0UY72_9TELE|nr:hypothetical protein QTP70_012084 [Hemibagrus guttatus]
MHSSNHIVKFTDDTIVVGLISKNDESAYREEVQQLTAWCKANNLSLNVEKMKEMVVDFRREQSDHSPLNINGSPVEIVKSTKFLAVHLAENFTWSLNTTSISKKAQQRLYFLQRLKKAHLPPPILTMFYRGTIESILSSCITAWFGNCTVSDHKTLQCIVRTAEKIIGVSLPSITDMPSTPRTRPAQVLFTPAPGYHAAWMQQQRKMRAKPRARTSPPPPPPVFEISTQNRFAPLCEAACDAVIIGDSIVRHVHATVAKGKVHTRCLPGARVLDVSAQVPAILKKNIRAVVLHAGTNDIRLRQTEIQRKDFRSLVEKVRTTSPTTRIIVSGPLPTFQRGIERGRYPTLKLKRERKKGEECVLFWEYFTLIYLDRSKIKEDRVCCDGFSSLHLQRMKHITGAHQTIVR